MQKDRQIRLAKSWIAFHERCHPERGDIDLRALKNFREGEDWASQELLGLSLEEPLVAIGVVRMIFDRSSDQWVLENLGAGPIEELFHHHDCQIMDELEQVARECPACLTAFQAVNLTSLSDQARSSLMRILGEG
jgi:hypothetical protein